MTVDNPYFCGPMVTDPAMFFGRDEELKKLRDRLRKGESTAVIRLPCYHGHRQRVQERFLRQGLEGFQDYEALELLLLFVARQRDMKPVAKAEAYFDRVVDNILVRDFAVKQPPEKRACAEYDFRVYCQGQGTIRVAR